MTIKSGVESCLAQTFSDFELIIIDDGSTDETSELLKRLSTKDPRIKIISNSHKGIVESLNLGILASTGDFIARMDADDEMFPERLEKQLKFLLENPEIGLVSCLVDHGGDAKSQEGYATFVNWINSIISSEEIAINRFVESPIAHPSVLFRKELIQQYGNYRDGNFPEDYELWLRWMDAGVKMGKVNEVLLKWNDLPNRLSRTDDRYSNKAFQQVKAGYLAEFITEQITFSDSKFQISDSKFQIPDSKFQIPKNKKQNPDPKLQIPTILNSSTRKLWLCGAGRITRQKSAFLIACGLEIGGFVDVDPNKIGKVYNSYPVISLDQLPPKENAYVVSYVGNRGAREDIRRDLKLKGLVEGRDFVMAG